MVDYSKWDMLEDDDLDLPQPPAPAPTESGLPSDLVAKLKSLQAEDPAALDKLNEDLERVKAQAMGATTPDDQNKLKTTIDGQKGVLENQLESMAKQRADLDDQMRRLEQLASAGDPASVLRFFEEQGLEKEDIQKMMGGSDADTKDVVKTSVENVAPTNLEAELASHQAAEFAESMNAVLSGEVKEVTGDGRVVREETAPLEPAEPEVVKTETKKKKKNQLVIPEFHQQVADGEIKMVVILPKLSNAADASLDIAPRQFKLRAVVGEEEFLVSSELLEAVDPEQTNAKWSKKKKTLTVHMKLAR